MKPVSEWDETDLRLLISNKVEESLHLEYKQSDALSTKDGSKNELAKDVSAFANSDGGKIIYGIIESGHLPVEIDDGSDDQISREWIEQVINSRISPRISGILIKPISLPSGRYAYVIDIPQSKSLAPHQSSDKRYYKRYNFQSIPMEDYEIRDVIRRSSTGNPIIYFSVANIGVEPQGTYMFDLIAHITNATEEPVLYATIKIFIDERMFVEDQADAASTRSTKSSTKGDYKRSVTLGTNYVVEGNSISVLTFSRNHTPLNDMPIYKEAVYTTCIFNQLRASDDKEYLLGYGITCPGFKFEGIGKIIVSDGKFEGLEDQLDLLNPRRR